MLTLAACVTHGDGGGASRSLQMPRNAHVLALPYPGASLGGDRESARNDQQVRACAPLCNLSHWHPVPAANARPWFLVPCPPPRIVLADPCPPLWPTHWFPRVLLHIDCACETDSDLLAAVCALRPFGVNLTILGEKRVPTPSFPRVCVCVRSCSVCVDGSCYLCMNAACRGARVSPSSQQNS